MLKELPQITQLVNGGAGILTKLSLVCALNQYTILLPKMGKSVKWHGFLLSFLLPAFKALSIESCVTLQK